MTVVKLEVVQLVPDCSSFSKGMLHASAENFPCILMSADIAMQYKPEPQPCSVIVDCFALCHEDLLNE